MGLGKSLKKIGKSIAKVVAPVAYYGTEFVTSGGKSSLPADVNKLGARFGIGADGQPVPFDPADKSQLFNTSGIDFLKDTSGLDFLKDGSKFDYLKTPKTNSLLATLPDNYKSFSSGYNPSPRASDSMFDDYLSSVTGPSSVDDVQSEIDSDRMRQLLSGVDDDTKGTIGSLKSDFADRGLGGAGIISDIEGTELARAYGAGDKTKAAARTEFAGKELERLKAKELARQEAYKARYGAGVGFDTQDRNIEAQGAMADANAKNDLLKTQATLTSGDLDRIQRGELTAADLTQKGNQAFADEKSARESLFAQLLNARELGAYGLMSADTNAAAERAEKYKEPSLFDKLLGSISIGL